MGNLPKLVYVFDRTPGPAVDPSGLQGPQGSSLCWSITQALQEFVPCLHMTYTTPVINAGGF